MHWIPVGFWALCFAWCVWILVDPLPEDNQ